MSGLTGNILMGASSNQAPSEVQDAGTLEEPVLTTIVTKS